MAGAAPAAAHLDSYRGTWQNKAVLRAVYGDYYRRMVKHLNPGPTLELGAGSGQLRDYLEDVVLTDIQTAPWLDAAADAQALPFRTGCFENIFMFAVLHHVEDPPRFFAEAARVLKPSRRCRQDLARWDGLRRRVVVAMARLHGRDVLLGSLRVLRALRGLRVLRVLPRPPASSASSSSSVSSVGHRGPPRASAWGKPCFHFAELWRFVEWAWSGKGLLSRSPLSTRLCQYPNVCPAAAYSGS